jgi:hypothetical protein
MQDLLHLLGLPTPSATPIVQFAITSEHRIRLSVLVELQDLNHKTDLACELHAAAPAEPLYSRLLAAWRTRKSMGAF